MSYHKRDRLDFWIHFVCGFLFFGLIAMFHLLRYLDSLGVVVTVSIWLAVTSGIAVLVGFKGDAMWHRLIHFLGGSRR